ncbi:hypothetical protein NE235_11710 [Actinoallomurus spadix]|uniref:Secreted protein n=1 Tax=Actinoallomurus spadix TaxID=79912 RepID=A0ABN0X4D5_9ACTN|nr:hypothetical protein [Actinoallomurus spadix]MCO5986767.1 hypothetical protein [Actinoallomurus spadix]
MRRIGHGRLFAVFGLAVCGVIASSLDAPAQAAPTFRESPAYDHNRVGNGRTNVNTTSIRSPVNISGVQIVADANTVARVSRNNAICKRHRHCRIRQYTRVGY